MKQEPTLVFASAKKTISEQERQLTATAFSHFRTKNYDSCLQQLTRLSELRPCDARVLANRAIVEYFACHLAKTDEFSKQLSSAKKQLEFGMVNTGDELDDIDRSFLLYNQAVIHFHLKQYKPAINILERLFKVIEPLGDVLALKVCILLVEVCLLSFQLEQAYGMISYIETMLLAPKGTGSSEKEPELQSKHLAAYKAKLHLFKTRLYLSKRSFKLSAQELEAIPKDNSPETCFLRAQQSCLQCDYQMSLKCLNTASKNVNHLETGYSVPLMYFNNIAYVQFYMGMYNLAVLYGRKALEENINVMKSLPAMDKNNSQSGRPVHTLAINRRAEIDYNIGVSLLFASKPRPAFEFLMDAQTVCQCNPRFWLRLAECCVAVFQEMRNNKDSSSGKKSPHVRGVIGSGSHRKIVLSAFHHHINQGKVEGQSAAMPTPTLEFANLCLTNAMLLLPAEKDLHSNMTALLEFEKVSNDEQTDGGRRRFVENLTLEAPPSEPIHTRGIYNLRVSILACHAYVTLGYGDYYKSLEFSRALLRMAHASAPYKFLARVYLIESLIKLDRVGEAIHESSPESLKSFQTFDKDIAETKYMEPFPKSFNEARTVMMLNLASAYCLRCEYDHCKQVLRQVIASELSPAVRSHAILISVYCDLKIGNVGSALNLLKRSEVFPPGRPSGQGQSMSSNNGMPQGPSVPQLSQLLQQQAQIGEIGNRDIPNRDIPNRDVPSRDVPNRDVPNRDVPNRDVPNRDVPNRDVPNRDVPNRDVPSRDISNRATPGPTPGSGAFSEGRPFPAVSGIPFPPSTSLNQQKMSGFSQHFPGLPSSQSLPASIAPIGSTFNQSAVPRPT